MRELRNKLKELAEKLKVPIISEELGKLLMLLIKAKKPKTILEIGSGIGFSTTFLIEACKGNKLITIEASKDNVKIMAPLFKKARLDKNFTLINDKAQNFLPTCPIHWDFVFLDAAKDEYLKIFDITWPKMNKDSIMIIDNMLTYRQKKETDKLKFFRDYISENVPNSLILKIDTGIGILIKDEDIYS